MHNSVRDVAISGNTLLVCDEPAQMIRLYALPDGTYLGGLSLPSAGNPTHLAIFANGLYVSAGSQLYWSSLSSLPSLGFTSILTAPAGFKIGGVTFDPSTGTAWVAFQKGTGGTGTGFINSYHVGTSPASPPVFGAGTQFAPAVTNPPTLFSDTPEFVLFVPNP